MLDVNKINKLEFMNNRMADTLIKVRQLLIDGYNNDMTYTAFDEAITTINRVDDELSKYYKQLKEV